MIALFFATALAAQSLPPEAAWTWTLYADAEPVVLANEVPDPPASAPRSNAIEAPALRA